MRSYIPRYVLQTPATLEDTLRMLAEEPGRWRAFAGGTDLMVLLDAGRLPHTHYLNLGRLAALRFVEVGDREVSIGSMVTYTDVRRHPLLRRECAMLCQAAAETGGVANQNRGTLGGNIANASPAADTPPALVAYGAEIELVSRRGARRVPYERFHTGYKEMDLAPDELIRALHVPRRSGPWREQYRKVGTRRAQAISKVCFAGALRVDNGKAADIRLALGSVAPTVIRARHAEALVTGRALDASLADDLRAAVARDVAPIDDIRSTARYRREVAANLICDFVASCAAGS